MRSTGRLLRGALGVALLAVAGVCIVRGLRDLFWGPGRPSGAASAVAGYDGIAPALGYFAVGLLALWLGGEAFPPGTTRPDTTRTAVVPSAVTPTDPASRDVSPGGVAAPDLAADPGEPSPPD